MKTIIIDTIEEAKRNLYQNTSMILDIVCEQLAERGIDATFKGRTIYLGDQKIATIQTYKEAKDTVGIDTYKVFDFTITLQEWAKLDENDTRKINYTTKSGYTFTSEDFGTPLPSYIVVSANILQYNLKDGEHHILLDC